MGRGKQGEEMRDVRVIRDTSVKRFERAVAEVLQEAAGDPWGVTTSWELKFFTVDRDSKGKAIYIALLEC